MSRKNILKFEFTGGQLLCDVLVVAERRKVVALMAIYHYNIINTSAECTVTILRFNSAWSITLKD